MHCDEEIPNPEYSAHDKQEHPLPNDVIDEIEDAIKGTDCTFSAFVVEAVRVALENLKEDSE